MTHRELDTVVLTLPAHGLRAGDLGAVVHLHCGDALEVAFVGASGHTPALVTLASADVRPVQEHDLVAVRTVGPSSPGAA